VVFRDPRNLEKGPNGRAAKVVEAFSWVFAVLTVTSDSCWVDSGSYNLWKLEAVVRLSRSARVAYYSIAAMLRRTLH
jgi:hypothetical protein